jgi:hypothetical protein
MKKPTVKTPYPPDWPSIATNVKSETHWKCIRCGHAHDPGAGYMLTVHHLDGDPSNCEWWNIPPLCQRCHLSIQGRVDMKRIWIFEHSDWFKIYVAGYYAHLRDLPTSRDYVNAHLDDLLDISNLA